MSFTDDEIAEHTLTIEINFWSKCRPPFEMRDKIRESQRFTGYALDSFYVRPRWQNPGETIDSPVARIHCIKSRKLWQVYWMRADLRMAPLRSPSGHSERRRSFASHRRGRNPLFLWLMHRRS